MASAGDQAPWKRGPDAGTLDTPPKRLCTAISTFPSSVPLPRSVVENSPPKVSRANPACPSSVPLPFLREKVAAINPSVPEEIWLPPAAEEKSDTEKKRDKRDKKDKKEKKDKKDKHAYEKGRGDLDHRRLFKTGQKHLTPPAADSTRAFYTSLFEENPGSKIAIKYLVENGVLPLEEHKRLHKKYEMIKAKEIDAKSSKMVVHGMGSNGKSSKFARHTQQARSLASLRINAQRRR